MKNIHAVKLGQMGGKKAAKNMTQAQRSQRAKKAVQKREELRKNIIK